MAKLGRGSEPTRVENTWENRTTYDVEEWIQSLMNASRLEYLQRNPGANAPEIRVSINTSKISKTYHPFLVMLPEEAVLEQRTSHEELGIFNISDGDHGNYRQLIPHVWAALRPFTYTKEERKAFMESSSFRANLGISRDEARVVVGRISPAVRRVGYGDGDSEIVCTFLLDPLKIFHAGTKHKCPDPNFLIQMISVEHLKDSNYSYNFKQVPWEKKAKKAGMLERTLEREIYAALRRGGRRD